MGIPKFYRWLSERYPLLNMPVTATEAPPEMDNLYLDMNGIIHNCTHANDPTLKLTETEMVIRIFTYLDKLIHIMKPKKLVFLAIDGVAPRAKMNQQRSRRFKSALERLAHEAEAEAKGEATPEEYKFDSNCITPGTGFMARLGKHLRFFIRKKISEDPVWQQPVVIFSGHDVPGEGEHKIMEYIRWQRRSPSHAPNQRHCMYGLDADLIMLSLVTHEPHFCLLREVVSFTGKNRGQPARETLANPCAENFILFQIGLLREYIELEFTADVANKSLSFPLDVERVIDDIVLFCMLVGNDFLPALPTLDIAEGALNQLIDLYKHLLPQLGGYLTCAGELNHERLQVLLGVVADAELSTLEERAADTEWFENKRSKRGGGRGGGGGRSTGIPHGSSRSNHAGAGGGRGAPQVQRGSAFSGLEGMGDMEDLAAASAAFGSAAAAAAAAGGIDGLLRSSSLAAAVPVMCELEGLGALEAEEEVEAGPTMMSREARQLFLMGGGEAALQAWKERYYTEKLGMPDAGPGSTSAVVEHYIRGLHWVLQYYYRGVASWDWFYPYHYAPMAQDMRRLENIDVSFNRGKPFKPFEQLLAVLPSASCTLLPPAFQWLMTDPRSPILDFYPDKFDIDMEGKRAEWEGVVKVPFISESRLLAAAASISMELLTAEERRRNVPGDMLVFEFAAGRHEQEHCDSTLPKHFGSIAAAHSSCRHVPVPEPLPAGERGFVPSLAKGTMTGKRNPPGFPTLKTMSNLSVELKMAGVNVFGNPAKKDSLVLVLPDVRSTIGTDAAAPLLRSMLCGRVYVKWPYLQEAEIMAVSDPRQRISLEGVAQHSPEASARWQMVAGQTKNMFLTKMGIDIGSLPLLLDARVCTGHARGADGSVRKEYARDLVPYPLQAVLQSRPKPPPGFADPDTPKALALPPGSRAIWVGHSFFGCLATVLADPAAKVSGTNRASGYLVRVQPLHQELLAAEGRARHTVQQFAVDYLPSGMACRQMRLNPRMLGRLTGNVWVEDNSGSRVDIGLAVKNAKQGLCVPALCRPSADGGGWQYSPALLDIVRQYRATFPSVIAALEPPPGGGGGGDSSTEGGGERRNVRLAELFPGLDEQQQDAALEQLRAWLKSQPSAKLPLVAASTQQASDAAVQRLQLLLPGLLPVGTAALAPVELDAVHPSLLLPPHDPAAPQSVLAGGSFEPGERVVVLRASGAPAFGTRGTVIGVLPTGVELLMDDEFTGGSTLNGRVRGPRGTYLPPEQLLNVSRQQPVAAPERPQRVSGSRMARPAAAAAGGGAASSAVVATRLVELAPWLRGKQLQQAQQQLMPADSAAAAADATQELPAAGPAPAAVPMPPTSQGGRLLQMLRKQQSGGAAGGAAPPQQQQQHQASPSMTGPGSAAGAGTITSLTQQLGSHAMMIADGSTQQQQPQAVPHAAAAAPAPAPPSASAGQSLLMKLQRGGSSNAPAAAAPPAAAVAPAAATTQVPAAGQGAQLLAMLQKQPSPAAPHSSGTAPGPEPPAGPAAAAGASGGAADAALPARQEQKPEKPKTVVKVVPRPKRAQQQDKQQQPAPAAAVPAAAAAAAAAVAATAAAAALPRRSVSEDGRSFLPIPAAAPVPVPAFGSPARSALRAITQRKGDEAAVRSSSSSGGGAGGEGGASPGPRTPPAGAGTNLLQRDAGSRVVQAKLPDGTRGFTLGRGQRLPSSAGGSGPAAPGSSGGGGGSGAGTPGSPLSPAAAAAAGAAVNGLRSGPLPRSPLAVAARGAGAAVMGELAAQLQQQQQQQQQPAVAQPLSAVVQPAAAAAVRPAAPGPDSGQALMKLLQRGGSSRGLAAPPPSPPQQQAQSQPQTMVPAASPPPERLLQPPPHRQPPSPQQLQQPAGLAVPAGGPGLAAVAPSGTAACNLLRRLQSRNSQSGS